MSRPSYARFYATGERPRRDFRPHPTIQTTSPGAAHVGRGGTWRGSAAGTLTSSPALALVQRQPVFRRFGMGLPGVRRHVAVHVTARYADCRFLLSLALHVNRCRVVVVIMDRIKCAEC